MRLNSIEIENITSLRGKHFIDFSELLKDDELFAITGATGSGKSSILSAISLALYGKNYKKALDSKDFVTLGASSATIQLAFETKGETYVASWTLKVLKKNGEKIKKPSPQRLLTKDGVAIDSSADEIIGLTFDQFIRSVVLNQGQFSRFITSNFSERRKILERLYSENEISEINKQLRENYSTLKQEIDLLKVKLEQGLPYDEAEILEAKDLLPGAKKDKDTYKLQLDNFITFSQQLRDLTTNSFKRSDFITKNKDNQKLLTIANDERNKATEKQKEFNGVFEKFKVSYDVKKEKYNKALLIESEIKNLGKKNEEATKELLESENKLKELNELIKKRNVQNNDLVTSRELLSQENIFSTMSSDKLKSIETTFLEVSSSFENNKIHINNSNLLISERDELKVNGEALNSKAEKKNSELNALSISAVESEFSTKTEEKLQEKINHYAQLISQVEKSLLELSISGQQQRDIEKQINIIESSPLKTELDSVANRYEQQHKDLQKNIVIFELEKRNESLIEFISLSQKENECIICETNIESIDLNKKKNDLIKSKKSTLSKEEIEAQRTQLEDLNSKKHGLMATFETQTQSKIDLQKKLTDLHGQLSNKKELENKKSSLEKEHKNFNDLLNKIREIKSESSILEEQIKSLRTSYALATSKLNDLDAIIRSNKKLIKDKSKSFSTTTGEALVSQESLTSLKQQIEQAKELIEVNKQVKHNLDFITQIQKQSFDNNERIKELISSIDSNKKNILDEQKSLKEIINESSLSTLMKELEEERETKAEHLKSLARNVAKNETNYARLLTMKDSIHDQMKISENAIMSTLGSMNETLVKIDTYKSSNHETNIFIAKAQQIKSYIDSIEATEAIKGANEFLIAQEIEYLKNQYEINTQNVTVFEEKIKLYELKSKEQKEDKEQLETKAKFQERYENLIDVLGKNKDEFRNFVLGFIEKQLIIATNGELNTICDGRYEIIQKESTHGHEFFILDSWNGGLERKVSTLSGGETFLVSLAMALSLAEMTRGQVDIDCFFIDEGFGSLDKDSIEDAFSALMSVRSRGKQIGIISHVKELTDRIGANVQLNKANDGQSKIEIVFN